MIPPHALLRIQRRLGNKNPYLLPRGEAILMLLEWRVSDSYSFGMKGQRFLLFWREEYSFLKFHKMTWNSQVLVYHASQYFLKISQLMRISPQIFLKNPHICVKDQIFLKIFLNVLVDIKNILIFMTLSENNSNFPLHSLKNILKYFWLNKKYSNIFWSCSRKVLIVVAIFWSMFYIFLIEWWKHSKTFQQSQKNILILCARNVIAFLFLSYVMCSQKKWMNAECT